MRHRVGAYRGLWQQLGRCSFILQCVRLLIIVFFGAPIVARFELWRNFRRIIRCFVVRLVSAVIVAYIALDVAEVRMHLVLDLPLLFILQQLVQFRDWVSLAIVAGPIFVLERWLNDSTV